MKYHYYPGCSLERNAFAYHQSAMAVARAVGLEFDEVDDWNCCGATEYFSLEALPAYALVARNLAKAAKADGSDQLVAPCSACFLNLRKTDHYMAESKELSADVNEALAAGGLSYRPGSIKTRHLLDVVVNDIGFDAIEEKVTRPLYGLNVAPYYGCLIVRPQLDGEFDNPEQPTKLDQLIEVLGGNVADFSLKANCCGGHMTQISRDTALDMIRRLLKNAADAGADAIVTLCPMCQLNLDAYQENVNEHFGTDYHIPILYFTQLMGVAFELAPSDLGFGSEFVDASPALAKISDEKPKKRRRKRRDKNALPMPTMPAT